MLSVQSWQEDLLSPDEVLLDGLAGDADLTLGFASGFGVSASESESDEDDEEDDDDGDDALEVAFRFLAFLVDSSDEEELEDEDATEQVS